MLGAGSLAEGSVQAALERGEVVAAARAVLGVCQVVDTGERAVILVGSSAKKVKVVEVMEMAKALETAGAVARGVGLSPAPFEPAAVKDLKGGEQKTMREHLCLGQISQTCLSHRAMTKEPGL